LPISFLQINQVVTHEFIEIMDHYAQAHTRGISCVLATVVSLEGSGYRRPGVRMLLTEHGTEIGAVSGGCVEKEVRRQAEEVFKSALPKMMTYDGRYRLGCEGMLHILLEPFNPGGKAIKAFNAILESRTGFLCESFYAQKEGTDSDMGSILQLGKNSFSLRQGFQPVAGSLTFTEELSPRMRLVLFGAEHDTVKLCQMASTMGWEVVVVVPADEGKTERFFPGISELKAVTPETLNLDFIDTHCAVVVMTHSYVKDLQYLLKLSETVPGYLGVLGPARRRERLLGDLIERNPEVRTAFVDQIHGPAGLDIGSETSQEIAVSILAEILAVFRKAIPVSLRNKAEAIHSPR